MRHGGRHPATRASTRARLLSVVALALLVSFPRLAASESPETQPFTLAPSSTVAQSDLGHDSLADPCAGFTLFLADERPADCPRPAAALDEPAGTERAQGAAAVTELRKPWYYTALPYAIPIGMIGAGLITALTDSPLRSFRFTNEGWFGQNTYAGGADKAAHFVNYTILSREMIYLYQKLGYSEQASVWLGASMGLLEGLANEFGDGFNRYGFSPQDATMDTLGSAISGVLMATRNEDLIGFRTGFLFPKSTVTCCAVPGKGGDYSYKIYTADLKLAGASRRLGLDIGPLRYLFFSVTYGSKFYPSGAVNLRERQVGFEIGLNFEEILNSLGARRDTWWGYGLHVILDNIRVPFTSVGFQYDLNHGRWYGPGNGNQYSTTP